MPVASSGDGLVEEAEDKMSHHEEAPPPFPWASFRSFWEAPGLRRYVGMKTIGEDPDEETAELGEYDRPREAFSCFD